MARDRYNREIDYLRVSITDRCNLGCVYCRPEDRAGGHFVQSEVLTGEQIVRVVRIACGFGVRKVRLTGGEPLLRPDILQIVEGIKAAGVRDLSLTTNGLMLAARATELKRAGLDRVNVSLDTLRAERFVEIARGGSLQAVTDGIEAAESAGLVPIKLNMVPMRGINHDEVVEFARLTVTKPWHIRFIEFMPTSKSWDKERCFTSSEAMEAVEGEFGKLEQYEFKGKGPSRNYRIPGAAGVIGFISAVSHSFCYSCNRLRLSAVGILRPCLFSKTSVDIGGPLRQGASDDELTRLFELAVQVKPEGNYLVDPHGAERPPMSSIGG